MKVIGLRETPKRGSRNRPGHQTNNAPGYGTNAPFGRASGGSYCPTDNRREKPSLCTYQRHIDASAVCYVITHLRGLTRDCKSVPYRPQVFFNVFGEFGRGKLPRRCHRILGIRSEAQCFREAAFCRRRMAPLTLRQQNTPTHPVVARAVFP